MTKVIGQTKYRLLAAALPAWLLCCTPGLAQDEFAAIEETEVVAVPCEPGFTPAQDGYDFIRQGRRPREVSGATRIGRIHYTRLPVFDETNPDEDNLLYRLGNDFHIMTRESVIEQIVLIEEGQAYDERLLQETERLLRRQNMFWDVDLRPVSVCEDEVDIEVITRDSWSFTPGIGFDRSGGNNTYSVNIRESNLFGSGKLINLGRTNDTDRTSTELYYEDNNVFGSRIRGDLALTDSSDGHEYGFNLGLPFFALDTRRSWRFHVRDEIRVDSQFQRGDEVTEVRHDIEEASLRYGFSRGLNEGRVRRWNVGYQYRRDQFAPGGELPPPAHFPREQTLSYPFVSYETIEDDYITSFNLEQIYRTEDLHVGSRFYHRMGYSATGLGADDDRIVMDGSFSDTLIHEDGVLMQHSLEWHGQWNLDTDRSEDVRVSWQGAYLRRRSDRHSFYASLEGVWTENLNSHRQVTLGGLEGARGFENRFQNGDSRVLLTLEQRVYTDIHLFNLIRLGGALFIDVGKVWERGLESETGNSTLANVGFGLRMMSSKAASRRVAHLDFAFPITNRDDPGVDVFLVAFNVKDTF